MEMGRISPKSTNFINQRTNEVGWFLLLQAKDLNGEIFNISDDAPIYLYELLESVGKASDVFEVGEVL
jgi:hypothetical protein